MKQLEGRIRYFGKHPSGILIADRPLRDILPLMKVKDEDNKSDEFVPMGDMDVCEKLGIIKFDVLGLKTLEAVDQTIQKIKERTGKKIDILHLPENDRKTYKMLGKAFSAGVFQMERSGAKNLLSALKPNQFDDLVAINALNRPAPLKTKGEDGLSIAERYVKIRNGELNPTYLHPDLEPILHETAGQLIYQEQMMQVTGVFAGFSLAERSATQKVISKKKPEQLAEYQSKFIAGCNRNGYSEDVARELWRWIEKGSEYLFNKSHSASYALLAYQTAYLKAHYPLEFITSSLSAHSDGSESSKEKFTEMMAETKRMKIPVSSPCVNRSGRSFAVADQAIFWGLSSIKGVGKACVQIVENRPYASFYDFIEKNIYKGSKVNKRVIVALVKAGAFDSLGDRIELMQQYQETRPKKEQEQKPLITSEEAKKAALTKYQWEQEVLGDTLTEHPLSAQLEDKQTGGEIIKVKRIKTKKGDPMAFIAVNSPQGSQDITVFPQQYKQFKSFLKKGVWIVVDIKKNSRGAIANRITEIVL